MQCKTERIWLVIEGDNGAGKDTLAAHLATSGFEIINGHPLAQTAE
jgi:ABC-type molybdenum transport system ATPase subunit/photorepair protein PhrA